MAMQSAEPGAPYYAYKPSLVGAPVEFTLAADAIEWRAGGRSLRVPYRDFRRIRLAFLPVTLQNYRFVTEFWSTAGLKLTIASASWNSMVEIKRQDPEYSAFVRELHRRIAAAGGNARFQAGAPALLYWPGVIILVGLLLATAALIVNSLRLELWSSAALAAAMLAFFLWQAGDFFRRNRPAEYTPDALPQLVMP
jgi:hypothetical protein